MDQQFQWTKTKKQKGRNEDKATATITPASIKPIEPDQHAQAQNTKDPVATNNSKHQNKASNKHLAAAATIKTASINKSLPHQQEETQGQGQYKTGKQVQAQ